MPSATERFTEVNALLGGFSPTAANAAIAEHATGWVSVAQFHRFFGFLVLGQAQSGASMLQVRIYKARDGNGTDAELVRETDWFEGTIDDDVPVGIELRGEELGGGASQPMFSHIQAVVEVADDEWLYSFALLGCTARYEPVDVTMWREIVA